MRVNAKMAVVASILAGLIVCACDSAAPRVSCAEFVNLADQEINQDTRYDVYFALAGTAAGSLACVKNVKALRKVSLYGVTFLTFQSADSKAGYVQWGTVVAIIPTGSAVENKVDYTPVQLNTR